MKLMFSKSPVTEHSTKFRLRKSPMGMTGSAARRSSSTKTTAAATARATRPINGRLPQGMSVPPQAMASTSEVTATVMAIMPGQSMGCFPRARASRGSVSPSTTTASRATGTVNQKIQRQPVTWTNQPPMSGPSTFDTANTAPMTPM